MYLSEEARQIFDALNEGILIIDTEERIVFGNRAYREFLERETSSAIGEIEGRRLRDLRPGAQLPEVLRTGKAVLQAPRQESADIYFVNMYPIIEDGTVIGGISVVTFMEDASTFRDKLESIEQRSRQLLRRVNKATSSRYTFDNIVAEGRRSRQCKAFAQRIAESEAPILLTSESGTGKEVYAQAIHNASPRRRSVFAAINCATFNPETLDSELFGYVDGAFPGAKKGGKVGLFEAAEGGTLFLDEISEMNLATQSKVLRALQDRIIRPVGSVQEIPVDVRVVAASNVDLLGYIAEGRFRTELYYRLNTFNVRIPALRERMEDLPKLANMFLAEISMTLKRNITISDDAVEHLMRHDWPGNVRELRNVLEFSAYLSPDGVIRSENLPENIGESARDTTPLYDRVKKYERAEILKTLEVYGMDLEGKKAASRELGISLASLYAKIKE